MLSSRKRQFHPFPLSPDYKISSRMLACVCVRVGKSHANTAKVKELIRLNSNQAVIYCINTQPLPLHLHETSVIYSNANNLWLNIYMFWEMRKPFSNCNSNENRNREILRRIDFACFVQIPCIQATILLSINIRNGISQSRFVRSFVDSLVHSNVWMWLANKSHSTRVCGCLLQSTVIYLRINWVKCWCIECIAHCIKLDKRTIYLGYGIDT